MSKVLKEEKQRNSHVIYKSNYEAKKEVIPLENKSKLIIQTDQAQKNHLHILKSEPNFNQKEIQKNNQHEKTITTIISSRKYNQGKEENKNSNISTNSNNKNNEEKVMFISKRKNYNISKEIQNENININNLTNNPKSTTYLIVQKDNKENKENKENKITISKNLNANENMKNKINDYKLIINNKRQSNENTKNENGNKTQQQRAQSQSKLNLQNNQTQNKYQVQKNISELTQTQLQNISKYNFNTSRIIKTPKTPSYKTNTVIATSRTNLKNIQQPQERKYIISASIVTNSKKQEILPKEMSLDRSSQNIYSTNSNKNEVNDKNKIAEKNNVNYLRSNSLVKLPEKNNIKIGTISSNLQNKNENKNKNKSPLPNRAEVKSNIQIHTITQIKNKQEKEKDKITIFSPKKTNIVVTESKYIKSNGIIKEGNNSNLSFNILINKNSQDVADKNSLNEKKRNIIDIKRSMKNISNIISHSIDDTKKNKKNEIVVAPRKHEVIVSKINIKKANNAIDAHDKRTKTPNICKISSKLDTIKAFQNDKNNFTDKICLNLEVGKNINNLRKKNNITYKDLRSITIDSKNNNNSKEVKNIIKDNTIQNNNIKNDNNIIELRNNKRKEQIDSNENKNNSVFITINNRKNNNDLSKNNINNRSYNSIVENKENKKLQKKIEVGIL